MSKKNYPIIVSPAAPIKYAHLDQPQDKIGQNPVTPNWNVTLALDPKVPEHAEFIERIKKAAAQAREDALDRETKPAARKKLEGFKLHVPLKPEVYGEGHENEGEPTGRILFSVKQEVERKTKEGKITKNVVDVVDSKRKNINPSTVGWGSTVKVAINWFPFSMPATNLIGASFKLSAVQVLKLEAPAGGRGKAAFGDEEGYTADDEAPSAFSEEGSTDTETKANGDY